MARVTLEGVRKTFEAGVTAVRDLDLTIEDGEFLVLVGPSGCGKSTLLRMVAGLERVTAGRILIDGRDSTTAPANERDLAMVFQNYALYPHMNVRRNLAFGLRRRGIAKDEIAGRVRDAARVLGLGELLERQPAELSGGQRQRVALGRAMVRQPLAFLMDEPLSNLDAKLRVGMRAELKRLHSRLGTTTLYVTHDQTEAMTLGSRVAVLRDGMLQQCGTPLELYDAPANVFVAAFIGSPQMNLVGARASAGEVSFGGYRLPLGGTKGEDLPDEIVLGIRPSDLHPAGAQGTEGLPTIEVTPTVVEELGSERIVFFPIDAEAVGPEATMGAYETEGDEGRLVADEEGTSFVARLPARTPVGIGEPLVLAVDVNWLHAFDPRDGRALRAPAGERSPQEGPARSDRVRGSLESLPNQ